MALRESQAFRRGGDMLKVGLTGGIGSGKSAAARHFADLGVSCVDADQVARDVVEPGEPALARIAAHFGPEILDENGALDRAALRCIIFSDESEKGWLEALLHPLIRERIQQTLEGFSGPYALLVSPLLFESGQDVLVDCAVVVDVDEATQVARTRQRDGVDEVQVRRILSSQMGREARKARADYLIDNSQGLAQLNEQVERVHRALMARAAGSSSPVNSRSK